MRRVLLPSTARPNWHPYVESEQFAPSYFKPSDLTCYYAFALFIQSAIRGALARVGVDLHVSECIMGNVVSY